MRGIVEDVLREDGVLTTDEIYCGVKAKHAQLRQLLPPRWQEEVGQILEAHCISHEGNSWFLKNIDQLEERPECEASLFDPHGTSERIINDSNRSQKRTDWANTESYRYLDLALIAGDTVRNVVFGIFLSGLRQLRRLAKWVYPRGRGPVWRLWQPGQAGREEAGRQGHSPERAFRSPSSITRTSLKMPETFESAVRFDEGVIRAPSTEAPRPAAGAVANRRLGLTGDLDRLSERDKQKLEKLGLLLSLTSRRTARRNWGGSTGSQSVPDTAI
jgi:hypothetical protein